MKGARYWVGADFGESRDRSAIAVVERIEVTDEDADPVEKVSVVWDGRSQRRRRATYREQPTQFHYHVIGAERPPPGTPYRRVAAGIAKRLTALEPRGGFGERGEIGLILDAGGVGRGVVGQVSEEVRREYREHGGPQVKIVAAQATAGSQVTRSGKFHNIPKRDLVSAALLPLEEKRLWIAEDIPEKDALVQELLDYRVKLSQARGTETFEAAGGAHDDMVFALALAMWAWRSYKPQSLRVVA